MVLTLFSLEPARVEAATAESDTGREGFYQCGLPTGPHEICTSFGGCRTFEVGERQCVRLDYEFSVGPGWSRPTTRSCRDL